MARPDKQINIPLTKDIKSITTLLDEGKTHAEIAVYFGVSQDTISRKIRDYNKRKVDGW